MGELALRTPTQLATRGAIDTLQGHMEGLVADGVAEQTIADCRKDNSEADHFFGEGIYARGLLIPAGTAVIGHIHKQDRVCIIAQGTCTFVDEWGKKKVTAPYVGEFKAGSKTAVYAHTDTYWVACLGTDIKDEDSIVEELLETSHEDYHLYLTKSED